MFFLGFSFLDFRRNAQRYIDAKQVKYFLENTNKVSQKQKQKQKKTKQKLTKIKKILSYNNKKEFLNFNFNLKM